MKHYVIAAITLAALAACGQKQSTEAAVEETAAVERVSGIDIDAMDKSVRPGDDFFMFMNGAWIDETEIPADKSSYGGFTVLRDESTKNVKAIIEESTTGDFAKGSDEQKVGDLYKSYMDMETRNAKGISPLQPELDRIDAIESYDDLAAHFGSVVRRGLDAPFAVFQFADFKIPTHYGVYAAQSGLGLPDREFYFNEDDKSVEIRREYVAQIEKMFDLAGFEDGTGAAQTIMALETRLAGEQMLKEDMRKWDVNYNKVALDDLPGLMPNFNWDLYLAETKISDVDGIIVLTTDYMEALDAIILDTELDTWKTYFKWVALNNTASRLTAELDAQNFAFYGTTLSGTEEQEEPWKRATAAVNGSLGEVVGKVYVDRHFPPQAKERMLELVDNLVKAYEKSISELEWMTDETKAQALDKLSKFKAKVGYPDVWQDYTALNIEVDDYFGNMQRAALVDFEREANRRGDEVDRTEWGMTPQTVNAYYNPPLNEIVFPAAILQPPFFNLDADDAVNYGAIGAVIGHEIGHGFDDSGSRFDGDGVLRNWWTDEDRAEFEKRTDRLVAQYAAFAPFDDLSVNGEFTLGENIGDLGGITIGLLAYKMSLHGEEPPVIDGFTGVQRVFLGYAQVWRNKYRDAELRNQIQTNPHAPSMYRSNGAVRNVPEWYEAFDISEDDELYLAPEDRVKIW
ncbi:MAG: peptidase M13 [Proteobacteria bacterium]|nr:peptidase M13 [Pseudomonadota bacterium]